MLNKCKCSIPCKGICAAVLIGFGAAAVTAEDLPLPAQASGTILVASTTSAASTNSSTSIKLDGSFAIPDSTMDAVHVGWIQLDPRNIKTTF